MHNVGQNVKKPTCKNIQNFIYNSSQIFFLVSNKILSNKCCQTRSCLFDQQTELVDYRKKSSGTLPCSIMFSAIFIFDNKSAIMNGGISFNKIYWNKLPWLNCHRDRHSAFIELSLFEIDILTDNRYRVWAILNIDIFLKLLSFKLQAT